MHTVQAHINSQVRVHNAHTNTTHMPAHAVLITQMTYVHVIQSLNRKPTPPHTDCLDNLVSR